ncbi:MAG: RNA methyltransferase, partial [Tannerella sp.]|nr:RNA methyltransferase [Tannerella sp.]
KNIYTERLASHGIIVMGNEGSGIRQETVSLIKDRLSIPPYPPSRETVESLNVATATAIVCAEFRRVTSGY